MRGIVLIPAYKPNEELVKLVKELRQNRFDILVVNDGSGDSFAPVFEQVSAYATVLEHQGNRGKGSALKTGIAYIQKHNTEYDYFITADADGQHLPGDIIRVREEMEQGRKFVLTTRLFKEDTPFRSQFGNTLSRVVFALLTGRFFKDNQSGLRGFSVDQCDWLLRVKGNYYDYEMSVLYYAEMQRIPITTLDIAAVYINENNTSHFNPVKDTVRIYNQLFFSARATLISGLFTEILLLLASVLFPQSAAIVVVPVIGILTVSFNALLCVKVSMRGFRFRRMRRMLMRTAVRYSIYLLLFWAVLCIIPNAHLFLTFNLLMLLLIAPEYYFLKTVRKVQKI